MTKQIEYSEWKINSIETFPNRSEPIRITISRKYEKQFGEIPLTASQAMEYAGLLLSYAARYLREDYE